MRQAIQQILFRAVDKPFYWIALALLVKLLVFLHGLHDFSDASIPGYWGASSADTPSYLRPLEQLIANGHYRPDFRMPGLALVYLPLRLLLPMPAACNGLLILQYVLSAVSVYYLAKGTYLLSRSRTLFYMVFYTFLISTYSNLFDYFLLSDSFCCSACIFCVYNLVRYHGTLRGSHIFLAGLFYAWAVFLRPVYALFPAVVLWLLYLLVKEQRLGIKSSFAAGLLFLSSFIMLDGAWIARNYNVHGRLIPLGKSVFYEPVNNDYLEPLSDLVRSFGGDMIYWNPNAEIRWFNFKAKETAYLPPATTGLPGDMYTTQFNRDSLLLLKKLIAETGTGDSLMAGFSARNAAIGERCRRYAASVQAEKPFLFYVRSPLKVAWRFVFENGTYNLFNKTYSGLGFFQKVLKWFYAGLYLLMAIGSALAVLCFPYRSRLFICFFPVLYAVMMYAIVFRFSEFRYLVPAYPFMVATVCCLLWHYGKKRFTFLVQ